MVKLTSMVKTSGCAAKLNPKDLFSVIDSLPVLHSDKLLNGYEGAEDALIWDLDDDRVLLETVDFFPPMVDDPYTFGQIAAANAISDIYAMGGKPAVCMNLVCFPACLELSVLSEILKGGIDKVKEAGCVIGGGHTISDPTPKYGLCVTGFSEKGKVWRNKGARVGDVLVLTKKLGVGIINTAKKAEMCDDTSFEEAVKSMTTLNKRAYECALNLDVHAATDVTGFSLAGHSNEMASASNVKLIIDSSKLNIIPGALECARFGLLPEGLYNNREYLEDKVTFNKNIPLEMQDLCFSPETSGGLLLSLNKKDAENFISSFGDPARVIGYVCEGYGVEII